MEAHTRLQRQLHQSALQLRRVNEWLQRQLVEPGIHQPTTLEPRIQQFLDTLPDPGDFPADSPLSGMQARAANIALYFDRLRDELRTLRSMPVPEGTLFLEAETWQQLQQTADEWRKGYRAVLADLSNDGWRRDLEFYKTTLGPRLMVLQKELNRVREISTRRPRRASRG